MVNISDKILTLGGKQLNRTKREEIPYLDVERFSGFTFEYNIPLQFCIKIEKTGFFTTIIEQDFYIPIFIQNDYFSYTENGVIKIR